MEKHYELFVGIDVSKGKADAAILKVSVLRSVKPKFLRKKLSFKFTKSEVSSFLSTIRSFYDDSCTKVTFGLEVTGIYGNNFYHFVDSQLSELEHIHYLDTDFVNTWRQSHKIAKSDPLDAQTIATIIGTDSDVRYVHQSVFDNQKGYQDLKALIHRYYQLKKTKSQEMNRLIAVCDIHFPELEYVFDPNSAAFLAILSSYPTTQDIINSSKMEVFNCVYQATKHRVSMDKIDKLYDYCLDTLSAPHESHVARDIVSNLVSSVKEYKAYLKQLEKEIKELASTFEGYNCLLTITGCGPITAATIIAETGDIQRFHAADKFVSYAGASPRIDRSGKSVEHIGKISKRGSRYLRHALYMIAEYARRHNPVLKKQFDRIKNGNKKRHRLAVTAIANKIARYVYSILKNKSSFVITYESLMRLSEETRKTFFKQITTEIPKGIRRQIYQYADINGEVHQFIFTGDKEAVI